MRASAVPAAATAAALASSATSAFSRGSIWTSSSDSSSLEIAAVSLVRACSLPGLQEIAAGQAAACAAATASLRRPRPCGRRTCSSSRRRSARARRWRSSSGELRGSQTSRCSRSRRGAAVVRGSADANFTPSPSPPTAGRRRAAAELRRRARRVPNPPRRGAPGVHARGVAAVGSRHRRLLQPRPRERLPVHVPRRL